MRLASIPSAIRRARRASDTATMPAARFAAQQIQRLGSRYSEIRLTSVPRAVITTGLSRRRPSMTAATPSG